VFASGGLFCLFAPRHTPHEGPPHRQQRSGAELPRGAKFSPRGLSGYWICARLGGCCCLSDGEMHFLPQTSSTRAWSAWWAYSRWQTPCASCKISPCCSGTLLLFPAEVRFTQLDAGQRELGTTSTVGEPKAEEASAQRTRHPAHAEALPHSHRHHPGTHKSGFGCLRARGGLCHP
jgi:hypothetical protein